ACCSKSSLVASQTVDPEACDGEVESSSSIRRRELQLQCSRCAQKFMTLASLNAHALSHRFDAVCFIFYGFFFLQLYSQLIHFVVYVCRLCCLAYESMEVFKQHFAVHGSLFNCKYCSSVAFNEQQLELHVKQHEAAVLSVRIAYICFLCLTSYSSENILYCHMFTKHRHAVIYFCKCCGFGCTNGGLVFSHILSNDFYEKSVQERKITVSKPSECVHRSFLISANEHIYITCPLCYTLVSKISVFSCSNDTIVFLNFTERIYEDTIRSSWVLRTLSCDQEFIKQLPDGNFACIHPECKGLVIGKLAFASVHCLRHNLYHSHFCLECGKGFSDEQEAVKHQIMAHRNGKREFFFFANS
uniref:C2H2-type domain-containing protein n=1 Tax=Syphacia muris TaxID=451379 RepID=A0A0N5AXU9_9BILA